MVNVEKKLMDIREVHPPGTTNSCIKFRANPSNICWLFFSWTAAVRWGDNAMPRARTKSVHLTKQMWPGSGGILTKTLFCVWGAKKKKKSIKHSTLLCFQSVSSSSRASPGCTWCSLFTITQTKTGLPSQPHFYGFFLWTCSTESKDQWRGNILGSQQ